MHYREADDAYFEIVTAEMTGLFVSTEATQYPETRRAFIGFCAKTNSLKTALFDMIEYEQSVRFQCPVSLPVRALSQVLVHLRSVHQRDVGHSRERVLLLLRRH